jgi:hypothetical protein
VLSSVLVAIDNPPFFSSWKTNNIEKQVKNKNMNISLSDNYTLSHFELHVRPSQLDDTKNHNSMEPRKEIYQNYHILT